MVWTEVPFADLLVDSRDGEWGEGSETLGHQLCKVVRGTDFADLNSPGIELPQRWIPDHLVERKKLQPGDIIFEMAGGTAKQSTGRSALLTHAFFDAHGEMPVLCASFCRHLRLDGNKYDPAFIYYLLQTLYGAGYMAVFNIQHTGVSRFQYTSFKKQTLLNVPDLPLQRKIGGMLSAYDALIENNRRRIGLLEKMAEEIYREWFVHMRFTGYETAKFSKGIPSDWQECSLGSIAVLRYGKALKEELRVPGKFLVYGSGGIVGTHNEAFVSTPGLIVGRKGNVGSVYYSDRGFFPIDTVYYVESRLPNCYLYFLLRSMHFINNDAAVPGLNREQAYSNLLLLPPTELLDKYVELVEPLFSLKSELIQLAEKLTKTRDVLLPRLISGKLAVESLDIQFPPGMLAPESALSSTA